MKLKIIILILILVLITGCNLANVTVSETISCEGCSDKFFSWKSITECKPICEEQFEESKGSIIFGTEVKELAGYQKHIQVSNGVKTVSCICKYK
jgi:hypothetical protein